MSESTDDSTRAPRRGRHRHPDRPARVADPARPTSRRGDALGPRRSSVFPAPARAVLGAGHLRGGLRGHRRPAARRSRSQLFNILPKIEEVDARAVARARQQPLVEMCPELSLSVMAGAPMAQSKEQQPRAGRTRGAVLGAVFGGDRRGASCGGPPPGARSDDVLDAFAGAWTALGVCLRDPACGSGASATSVACAWRSSPERGDTRRAVALFDLGTALHRDGRSARATACRRRTTGRAARLRQVAATHDGSAWRGSRGTCDTRMNRSDGAGTPARAGGAGPSRSRAR